ncbi:MAG: HAMP domain-containing sensor histidine kinase [Acidimicrobiia bacterium]
MTPHSEDEGALHQFASTYANARWFIGAGMIGLTSLLYAVDSGSTPDHPWVMAVAGAVIIAHALAMRMWDIHDITVALLVDATATFLAASVLTTSGDHTPALLTMVGASVLIALFTQGWVRYSILGYGAAFGLVALLVAEDWAWSKFIANYLSAVFVATLIIGAISAIRSRLAELEASRAQTIGVVSHELRNHLTGVIAVAEMIRDDDSRLQPGEMTELLDLAYQQAVEAGEVIEDLLTASRAERGILDAIPELVDLCPITETVIRRTSVGGREFVFDFSRGPVLAIADPLRYKQIMRNLLTNAIRYGGETVRVSIESIGPVISVVVADNGEGVDPADEQAMFQPYRGGRQMKAVSGSSGLGLWIARGLAQKMGGDLTYRRHSGQSLFELVLPAADGVEPTSPTPALISSSH